MSAAARLRRRRRPPGSGSGKSRSPRMAARPAPASPPKRRRRLLQHPLRLPRRRPMATGSRRARSPAAWPSSRGSTSPRSSGSGPGGRIVKADIDGAAGKAPADGAGGRVRAGAPPAPAVVETDIPHEAVKLSNMRKTIARRLTEAKQTIPHIYLTVDIRLDALLEAARRAQQGPREPRREAQRQRHADQGARRRPDRGARVQRLDLRRPAAQIQPRRHLGRGVDPGRADHADHRRRRRQVALGHLQGDERARRPRQGGQAPAPRISGRDGEPVEHGDVRDFKLSTRSSTRRRA